jgi:2-dehydropantoate 2-reductase
VGAVTRQPFNVFRSVPESRELLRSVIAEGADVGRAKGVSLADDVVDTLMKRIDGLPDGMVASMQKDIMEGRPSELDAQTGAMIRLGRATKISTPANEFIYASLLPMEIKARSKKG